jgi:hypothetical protein
MSDRATRDADAASSYAASCIAREDSPLAGERRNAAGLIEDYATDLLDQIGADVARLNDAGREAGHRAAEQAESSEGWRLWTRAVELCQRAAQLAAGPH